MGSTLERYEILVGGLSPERISGDAGLAFDGCHLRLVEKGEPREGSAVTIRADVERGGVALSELLRRLLAAGATILSCTRHETSLQEVFDLVAGEGAEGGVPGRPAAAGSKGPSGGRSAS